MSNAFFICFRLICFIILTSLAYAGKPLWSFDPVTPTHITLTANSTATVQYRVTNQAKKTHTLALKTFPGLSQNVSPGNCADPFILAPLQSCILNLQINGSELQKSITQGPVVCEANPNGSPNPNSCYRPSPGDNLHITLSEGETVFGYVADNANIWQCPINTAGTIQGSACTVLTNATPPGFSTNTWKVRTAIFSGTHFAYIGDIDTTLWQCPLNASGGFVGGACNALTNSGPGFDTVLTVTFASFSGVTYGYVADGTNILWQCPMTSAGAIQDGTCTALTNSTGPGFWQTAEAAFGTFGGTTYAYVADDQLPQIWQCPMNASGGISGGACTALTNATSPGFDNSQGITLATFSGTTYAYVSDLNFLWQCPLNSSTGQIAGGACTALTNATAPGFSAPVGIAFATFAGITYGYVQDLSSTLWQCPMNATGGFSGGCTALTNATSPGFNSISGIDFARLPQS